MTRFNRISFAMLLLFCSHVFKSQDASKKPKLVVGIVIDQMRNDFIYRYWNRFGNGGFKRLCNKGYYFRNAHYNYIPTYTGPGHCSIFTGATPRAHGIIANDWHLKGSKKSMYCVKDTLVKTVGAANNSGKMSPLNQLSSTIGDELKMSSNGKSKVFGLALKDRSAILPAGRAANGAYWFDDETGNFVSSTWYLNELPQWMNEFNQKKAAINYLKKGWNTLYPLQTYSSSIADDNNYEGIPNKKDKPVFPYEYSSFIENNKPGIVKATPYGNSITKDLAMACISAEQLGADSETDLLSISFSSPDIVAHSYGPRSVEVEDLYLRLDKDLEELLSYLDKNIGVDNYLLFLTADHGGADVPNHLMDNKIAAGYTSEKKIRYQLRNYCQIKYGDSLLIENVSNEQVFLDDNKIKDLRLDINSIERGLCTYINTLNEVSEAYPAEVLRNESFFGNDYRALLQNGYNHKLSGNIAFFYKPGWMDYSAKGTTHGAGYNYDTHVPVIFYGAGIKKGSSFDYIGITQIAPTVCELLNINQPNSCNSVPLGKVLKRR